MACCSFRPSCRCINSLYSYAPGCRGCFYALLLFYAASCCFLALFLYVEEEDGIGVGPCIWWFFLSSCARCFFDSSACAWYLIFTLCPSHLVIFCCSDNLHTKNLYLDQGLYRSVHHSFHKDCCRSLQHCGLQANHTCAQIPSHQHRL